MPVPTLSTAPSTFPLRFSISDPNAANPAMAGLVQSALDAKTKPLGSLGRLESLAVQIGVIQQTTTPTLQNPHVVVFAGDHGITSEGVSAYPSDVTAQMVLNFLRGGAAINVLARSAGLSLVVVDAGVKGQIPVPTELLGELLYAKVAHGTKNFAREPAMTLDECLKALETGASIVRNLHDDGVNVVGFGEMGIGNTSSAAALMSLLGDVDVHDCVGRGTGLTDEQLRHKIDVITAAVALHKPHVQVAETSHASHAALEALRRVGGLEIAMICGAVLQAAEDGMVILVDGFIASAAVLCAVRMFPEALAYCVFAHESDEHGHAAMLRTLGAEPLLRVGMRLGEGSGAALAYPIVRAAVALLNEMATFASAAVSERES
jgi:nicotinate-nucleotide--dimethylbenzimidazole phosphoribosyltransferase